jgi:hypothetical protein
LRLSKVIVLLGILLGLASSAIADTTTAPARPLPATIGKFRRVSTTALSIASPTATRPADPDAFEEPLASEISDYTDSKRNTVSVNFVRLRNDAKAYAMLSLSLSYTRETKPEAAIGNTSVGTAAYVTNDQIAFFK